MTRIALTAFALCLLPSATFAQQPQQQTPSQVALQITSVIGQWAQAIEALQQQNAALQRDLAAVTKERDDLKAKQEPAK